jgi:hypothetical protein
MLECGHSVCKNCIAKHLHPFKKDSMILCEKCTKSTVARRLKDSLVIEELVLCFGEIMRIITKNN